MRDKKNSITLTPLILLASVSFWGAAVYRLYSLNATGVAITLLLAIISTAAFVRFAGQSEKDGISISSSAPLSFFKQKGSIYTGLLYLGYLLAVGGGAYFLFRGRTGDSLISPWEVTPTGFFILYFIASLFILIIAALRVKPAPIFIIVHYFFSFSVCLAVYKIGYGFDPFIHQASMELIDQKGAIEPKPYYYLGQYAVIILFHKLTFVPIEMLNKLLVPALAALSLPFILLRYLRHQFSDIRITPLLTILMLILPFSFFIVTTPQNFSYIFLLITLFYGLTARGKKEITITYFFSLTTTAIHPLTGIPAVLLATMFALYQSGLKDHLKKYAYTVTFLLSAVSLPGCFYILGKLQPDKNVTFELAPLKELIPPLAPAIPGREDIFLNFAYMYEYNFSLLFLLIAAAGILLSLKGYGRRILAIPFTMGAALLLSFVITQQLSFQYLIEYERGGYTSRMITVAGFMLLPFVLISFYAFGERLGRQKLSIKIPFFLFLAALLSVSLYLSYPRLDAYHNSHGYSVSEQSLEAVKWIEQDAKGEYIVLANQQVGVSALRVFGFDRYPRKNVYFYPIPTGGELYEYYLDMVYEEASLETMKEAMNYAGVERGYFVLNEYWWAFSKIRREAEMEAEKIKKMGGGEIYIFKYTQ